MWKGKISRRIQLDPLDLSCFRTYVPFVHDYNKLNLKDRDSWSEAIGSLQLPFYLVTYSTLTRENPENIDSMFLLLGRARIDSNIEVPLFKNEIEFKENFENLTQVIFSLLKEIVSPGLSFLPTIDPKKNCGRCAYGYICTN